MLVLDDPLSAVDTDDRAAASSRACATALAGRTVLLATQRLSTLALADRVVVLDDGESSRAARRRSCSQRGGAFTALFGEETVAA